MAVLNFPPRRVADSIPDVLALGAVPAETATSFLLAPDSAVPNGSEFG